VWQLPVQLAAYKIAPERVGLRRARRHQIPTAGTPTELTRQFILELHDYIMMERV
jgi:hypothetical protein